MKYAEADRGRASRISRLALLAGLVLLVPGRGLTLTIRPPANDHAGRPPSAAADDDRSDREKMQGSWKLVRCEFSGRNQDQALGVEDTISDGRWLRPNRRTAEYRLKLDSTKVSEVRGPVGGSPGRSDFERNLLAGRRQADDLLLLRSSRAEAHRIQDHGSNSGVLVCACACEEIMGPPGFTRGGKGGVRARATCRGLAVA